MIKCQNCGSEVYVRMIRTYDWTHVDSFNKTIREDWTDLFKMVDEGELYLQVTCPQCGEDIELSEEDLNYLDSVWEEDYVITETLEIL